MPEWKNISLVTFDIFDTLLHRKVKAPVDIFEFVRLKAFESDDALYAHDVLDNYSYYRMRAERECRERRVREHGGEGEVVLPEIYLEFQAITACSNALRDDLQATELAFEDAFLFASPEGLKRYLRAKNAGLKIVLISDMYLSAEWLGAKLERAGFPDAAKLPIYVSGERRASKHSGALYDLVAKDLGVHGRSDWLHIGDNEHADVARAQEKGLRTAHAKWALVDNRFEAVAGFNDAHAIKSLMTFLGMPQADELLPSDQFEKLGYKIWGPMLFGFTLWLLNQCEKQNLKKMLFIARDGWLPLQLFNACKDKVGLSDVTTKYFYMSRKSSYLTGLREWDTEFNWDLSSGRVPRSAERALQNLGISAEDYVAHSSKLGLSDVKKRMGPKEHFKIKEVIDSLYLPALRASRDNRESLESYYAAEVSDEGQIGFVDIGWRGNIQRNFINSISDMSVRSRVCGLYLGTLEFSQANVAKGLKLRGWICDAGNPKHWEETLVSGGVELMEFVLTADHGSTLALERSEKCEIMPVLEDQKGEEITYRENAMRAQAGVRRFFDDYRFLLDHLRPESLCSPTWAHAFERLTMKPTRKEAELLGSLTHSDAPGGNDDRMELAPKLPLKYRLRKGRRYRREREASFWKAGFDKRNS